MFFKRLATGGALLFCGVAAPALFYVAPAAAQSAAPIRIAAKPVSAALTELAQKTGANVLFSPEAVAGLRSTSINVTATPDQAARLLLAGTSLEVVKDRTGAIIVRARGVGLEQISTSAGPGPQAGAVDQPAPGASDAPVGQVDEIIVTATRRFENIQDVPMTVTPVTARQIDDLKLQRFEDVQQLSPGLALNRTGRIATSSLRGVTYNPDSNAAPSLDTYMNEVPISPEFVFQSIFDVQQIEVLRGPQGLNRGRPAPVGAITLTTRRPDMDEFSGSFSGTASEFDAYNLQAAISVPIVNDVLAFRLAALYDKDSSNGVRNFVTGDESRRLTRGVRATLEWRPTADIDVVLAHNRLRSKVVTYTAVEGPGAGYNGPVIADGRALIGVTEGPALFPVEVDLTSLNVTYDLPNHRLSYNLGKVYAENQAISDLDPGNTLPGYSQLQWVGGPDRTWTHELRLESSGPDRFVDYTVGLWHFNRKMDTFVQPNPPNFRPGAFGSPLVTPAVVQTPDLRYSLPINVYIPQEITNKAIYANLTFHLTPRADFNIGGRYFKETSDREQSTVIGAGLQAIAIGTPCAFLAGINGFTGGSSYAGTCDLLIPASVATQANSSKEEDSVYGASLRYKFTDDVLGYVSYGRSWRPGGITVGVQGVPANVLFYDPETSKSYEVGVKTEWFERRLTVNAAVFRQEFDGYINTSGFGIPYVNTAANGTTSLSSGAFTFNADAITTGAELEIFVRPTDNWNLGLSWATADGYYDNAFVPCRDSNNDGTPDNLALPIGYRPANGATYATCPGDGINNQPNWTFNAQSELIIPMPQTQMEGYLRGLWNYRPAAQGSVYTIPSYSIVNLFAGVRTEAWDFGVFARNLLDEDLLLSDPAAPNITSTEFQFDSGYRAVDYLRGRELGVSLSYRFGAG